MSLCGMWGWFGIGIGLEGGVIVCIQGARNWGRFLPETVQGSESERKAKGSSRPPAATTSPGSLLEVQALRSHSRPLESESAVSQHSWAH